MGVLWDFLFGNNTKREIDISVLGQANNPQVTASAGNVILPMDIAGGLFGSNKRAAGGPVYGGTPYLVGENGPEIFMPDRDGYVLPDVKPTVSVVPSGGGRSGSIVISPVLNFNAPVNRDDGEYIKDIVTKVMEKIAEDLGGGVRAGLGLEVG